MLETILKLDNVTKVYGNGTVANRDINIEFKKGEIHSVVGENGAGKSTLMKIIFGIEKPSSGTITYKGKEVNFASSMDAIKSGIGMVHQHFMLIPSFTVADNIILGDEPTHNGIFINMKEAKKRCQELSDLYHFDLDVNQKISELSVGKRQKVEILKTLYRNAELIILDEPTSVLTPQETEQLFVQLKDFAKQGKTILFISHKLDEVKKISDEITVMRNGVSKGTYQNNDLSMEQLTNLIIGRNLESDYSSFKTNEKYEGHALKVTNLTLKHSSRTILDDVSISVKNGEILGIAGVEGNGQIDLVKCITGLQDVEYSGEIDICGVDTKGMNVKQRRDAGMAYVPEDRMEDGIAGDLPISDNLIATYQDRDDVSKGMIMDYKNIHKISDELIDKFSVKTDSRNTLVNSLSGGNIQKVVVAREYNTNSKLMVAEQPTHGIDIGSAEFIHHQLINMRNAGAGVLLVSADLNEVMNLSDRIIVMYGGKVVGYFPKAQEVSDQELGLYMLGVKKQSAEELGGLLND